jgi:hypothetical protein
MKHFFTKVFNLTYLVVSGYTGYVVANLLIKAYDNPLGTAWMESILGVKGADQLLVFVLFMCIMNVVRLFKPVLNSIIK